MFAHTSTPPPLDHAPQPIMSRTPRRQNASAPARRTRERKSTIKVTVIRSTEAIDFDAWCDRYVRACLEAMRDRGELPAHFPETARKSVEGRG